MTLMDARVDDATPNNRRRAFIIALLCVAGVFAITVALAWNLPAEYRVNRFFTAVEKQDLPQAFGIWNNDPSWQQHAQQYATNGYPYGRFVNDWGTGSDYGIIKTHRILHATSRYGNSTLLAVEVNGRKGALLTLAVENQVHAMNFSPFALSPADTGFGWTYWQINYR
jgi:hypothetical protein